MSLVKKYFTTPIYYVNDVPHIGHAYCTLATDTLARYWRTKIGAQNVFFLTGTDENSQKTVEAAQKAGKDIHPYLDEMSARWRQTWDDIGISYDDFIRTTEDRHIQTVQNLFQKIYDAGDIYPGKYVGKYCTGCEAFLKDAELDEDGNCAIHRRPPQLLEEDNYFFRLSKYQEPLLRLFEDNPHFLEPTSRRNEILSWIKSGLEDISITRQTAEFGIPAPIDETQKVYVWFDALINYYSAVNTPERKDFWPEAFHIVGKEITRFHAVIWPAMLMSAGISLPKGEFAHGFFTIDGVKMSKSLGNVVSPVTLCEKYGRDAVRVGLLSSFEFGNEGDFSLAHFDQFYATSLAGGVGNLFFRVLTLLHKFQDGKTPEGFSFDDASAPLKDFEQKMEELELAAAIQTFFSVVQTANQRLNETEVWKIAESDPEKAAQIFAELTQHLYELRDMARVLLPFTTPAMDRMLGDGSVLGQPEILFAKIEKTSD